MPVSIAVERYGRGWRGYRDAGGAPRAVGGALLPQRRRSCQMAAGEGRLLAIEGTEGLVLDYARCCYPLPGDEIRGNVSVGRGIVVHRVDCRQAKARPQDRMPLAWSENVLGDYFTEIRVKAENRRGLLAEVTAEIAGAESSIENVQMPDRGGGEAIEMRFVLSVKSRTHLARVLRRIRRVTSVERVARD